MQTAPTHSIPSLVADSLIVDRQLPVFDVRIAEHTIVDAGVGATWEALCALDLLDVHTPLLDAAFWLRGMPARLRGRADAPPPQLILGEAADAMPGWLVLGTDPEHELALGAVGRFWTPTIAWHDVTPEEFAGFDEAGWGRIAVSFSLRTYGERRTLLTYECRTATHDRESRRAFARYWRIIRPFVGHIMRATLHTIAVAAREEASS